MTQHDGSHIRIYDDHSVLVHRDGSENTFREGTPITIARQRYANIEQRLASGYLNDLVEGVRNHQINPQGLDKSRFTLLQTLVSSITSDSGRALVGLAVLVLAIKAIEPKQSIRLHKGGARGDFSWQDGLSMRTLDAKYCTPVLRQNELVRLNKYGIFVTRSLAENYPYSRFYKAAMRGAQDECFAIIDLVEESPHLARPMLENLINLLIINSDRLRTIGDQVLAETAKTLNRNPTPETMKGIIARHIRQSTDPARLLEVAMHSLFQVFNAQGVLEGELEVLSQMRSANKKHGNVGDIEIVLRQQSRPYVLESWDAKYGKPYLKDELEELSDKLEDHPETLIAGFVVDRQPEIDDSIRSRMEELSSLHSSDISIQKFDDWIDAQMERFGVDSVDTMRGCLTAYVESLARRRLILAPIDEPAHQWLEDLLDLL